MGLKPHEHSLIVSNSQKRLLSLPSDLRLGLARTLMVTLCSQRFLFTDKSIILVVLALGSGYLAQLQAVACFGCEVLQKLVQDHQRLADTLGQIPVSMPDALLLFTVFLTLMNCFNFPLTQPFIERDCFLLIYLAF